MLSIFQWRTGQTIGADGDSVFLYNGAADSSIALATGSIRSLLAGWIRTPAKKKEWLGSRTEVGTQGWIGIDFTEFVRTFALKFCVAGGTATS